MSEHNHDLLLPTTTLYTPPSPQPDLEDNMSPPPTQITPPSPTMVSSSPPQAHIQSPPTAPPPDTNDEQVSVQPSIVVYTNKYGNEGISVDGVKFKHKSKKKNGDITWRCCKNKCICYVVTTPAPYSFVSMTQHNHDLLLPTTTLYTPPSPQPVIEDNMPPPPPSPSHTDDMQTGAYFVVNQKGGKTLVFKNHIFYKKSTKSKNENVSWWRCSHYKKSNCKCRVRVADDIDKVYIPPMTHNHDAVDECVLKKMEVASTIRKVAVSQPDEKPMHLITGNIAGSEHYFVSQDLGSFRRKIQRSRRKFYPRLPKTKAEALASLEAMTQFDEDDELVREVKGGIAMIARKKDLELLNTDMLQMFCDGTFKYSPRHFKQMYTFLVHRNGFYLPVAHFLLQNKKLKTYKNTLGMLKKHCDLLGFDLKQKLSCVMMDFEWSMMKAIKTQFKGCQILGCRFHLGQSWWRKIKNLGLSQEYKDVKSKVGQWLRGVFGLALLPHELVPKAFNAYINLKHMKNPCAKVKKFIDYLKHNYISPKSQFPPKMWAGIKGKATNNGAEAFHRCFGDLFGYLRSKPGIWHFLRNMRRFNVWKTVNMSRGSINAYKYVQPDFDSIIQEYQSRKIRVASLMKKLSVKNQPKMNTSKAMKRKRPNRK